MQATELQVVRQLPSQVSPGSKIRFPHRSGLMLLVVASLHLPVSTSHTPTLHSASDRQGRGWEGGGVLSTLQPPIMKIKVLRKKIRNFCSSVHDGVR